MRKISILGATGSVGQSTIKVIKAHKEKFDIQALTANQNVDQLAKDAIALDANYAVIAEEGCYNDLKSALSGTTVKPMAGRDSVIEAAGFEADWIMAAIVGMAGLEPLMKAIEQGTTIAIANKEPLVAAGPFVMEAVEKHGATLLPIDSEHNAIFQVFENHNREAIARIILTASGGPFRDTAFEAFKDITPDQALAHPNWDMGAKISIDSATMMNKALEVIEAQRLFDVAPDKIEVLVHPQSVVHSMVEYVDGSILAQLGASDMCTPITNVLGYPERYTTPGERLDLKTLSRLDFHEVDNVRFPFVNMAYNCLKNDLNSCIAMNTANEVAVEAFLGHKIAFLDIYKIVQDNVASSPQTALKSLYDVIEYDNLIREKAESDIQQIN